MTTMPLIVVDVNGRKWDLAIPTVVKLEEAYYRLADFDGGECEGGPALWERAHEEITRRFYASPPLVSASRPHQHQALLDDYAFASRERGREAVLRLSIQFQILLFSTSFAGEYLEPFEAKSVEERKEIILKGITAEVRANSAARSHAERHRKLVPEINVEDLAGGDGKGLRRLVERLEKHLWTVFILTEHPFPHPDVFRKLGLDNSSSIPLSESCRAYIDEQLLVRHSLLFSFLIVIFETMKGRKVASTDGTGNFASDFTPQNAPHQFGRPDFARRTYEFRNEHCSVCRKTAEEAGKPKLLRHCQKSAWKTHKKTCGVKLREAVPVPNFQPTPPGESLLPSAGDRLRDSLLDCLDDHPNAIWGLSDHSMVGVHSSPAAEKAAGAVEMVERTRAGVRSTAYKALRDSDATSIDVLACLVVPYEATDAFADICQTKPEDQIERRNYKWRAEVIRKDFKTLFDLEGDKLAAAIKRGEKELENPERRGERQHWLNMHRVTRLQKLQQQQAAAYKNAPPDVKRSYAAFKPMLDRMAELEYQRTMHKLEKLDLEERATEAKKDATPS
ncbi:hypothetical protein JCM8097_003249 [Rhodosporidiobolus ruineniae]